LKPKKNLFTTQKFKTGFTSGYGEIAETFSPAAMKEIEDWIITIKLMLAGFKSLR
jgi:hypothetical protein